MLKIIKGIIENITTRFTFTFSKKLYSRIENKIYSTIVYNRTISIYAPFDLKKRKINPVIEKKLRKIVYTKKTFSPFVLIFLKNTTQKIKGRISVTKVI